MFIAIHNKNGNRANRKKIRCAAMLRRLHQMGKIREKLLVLLGRQEALHYVDQ